MARSTLCIEIRPAPGSNDHEVRFLVDDRDFIAEQWADMLGLDPDDILREPCELLRYDASGTIVARCSCGVVGCGSEAVSIARSSSVVTWSVRRAGRNPVIF